ncbi:PREDICTED: geraniol 8-hydroxylase-like [Nicotiana attenuata]|uniref:7-ethoxycoumarin o-deethylase n=1 Tax=Nicotiana attenuata TaxID=49451 RepID=A0A314KRL3_NICAT|nr:PREDICTED: geraniol 8-hydroxylase-like [Nicotiana attenuata]OIT31389.1 7-ethoxycoumarin o-deethylase [Nicotiana attenuata]
MEDVTILLGLLSIWIFVYGVISLGRSKNKKRLAPGPFPLPIIGNLHLLGDKPHISLAKLSKIHGPIMNLKLGQVNTVVISSSALAREVMQKRDLAFANRSVADALRARNHSDFSAVFLPVNTRWRTLRKIMNSNIFSGNKLDANQHLRTKKIQELVDLCHKSAKNGETVDIGRAAFTTSLNLLSNTIFSKDLTDPFSDSAKEFKDLVWGIMVEAGKPNLVDYFPFLEKIDPQGIRRRMTGHFNKVLDLMSGLIDERLKERKLRNNANVDVLDALLNISPEELDRNHIEHMCLDLFVAGTDTTSNTLEWAMAELLMKPHTLEKAQEELARVIGRGKLVDEADVAQLPYLRCIVKETLRIHPALPFLIPRKVEEDVELCGYIVPKDSQVLVNVWAIGRDSGLWENPLVFKPERFWESEIDVRGRDFELIPFGAGRRICPGLPLAIRMVPVALGSLLNTFNWKLQGGVEPTDLDMEEKFGITLGKAIPLLATPVPL